MSAVKSYPLETRQKLSAKLEEYGEEINNEDVYNYILFLVYRRKKSKEELLKDLKVFFEDQTQDFISWACSSRYVQEKPKKCKFFPECNNANCSFFHPTIKCSYYPNCKNGKNCSYIHEDGASKPHFNGEKSTKGNFENNFSGAKKFKRSLE